MPVGRVGTSQFPGVEPGSKEYVRLQSQRRRASPVYREQQKQYRLENKEKILAKRRQTRLNLSDEAYRIMRDKDNLNHKRWQRANPAKAMWTRARDRAIRKRIEFTITVDDIIIPEYCPVFNIKLTQNYGKVQFDSMTLDRIDNTKGYIKGNIIVVSHRANTLKNDASLDELQTIVDFYRALA